MFAHKLAIVTGALAIAGALMMGCGESAEKQLDHGNLSVDEAVAAVHVPCLDSNQDLALSAEDFGQPLAGGAESDGDGIDFNADGTVDDADAAFLDVDLQVAPGSDPAACGDAPLEYLVASDTVPAITCDDGARAIVIVGVAGGVVDLRNAENAAGVRWMTNALIDELDERDYQTLALIAGPGLPGIDAQLNSGMETWIAHSLQTVLDQYPCAQAVLLGHSHGAITTDVVASRLEEAYGNRILLVVSNDRIEGLYMGDTQSRPQSVPVFNIFETNDSDATGASFDAPNVENWDASGEQAPEHGEDGGASKPVNHTTIDNSAGVRDRIIDEVVERLP
ncbi:MAG: hypothetical protein WEB52_12690 [Dehalococcoidia bacterium]